MLRSKRVVKFPFRYFLRSSSRFGKRALSAKSAVNSNSLHIDLVKNIAKNHDICSATPNTSHTDGAEPSALIDEHSTRNFIDDNFDLDKEKFKLFADLPHFTNHAACAQIIKTKASLIHSKANASSCNRMYFLFKIITSVLKDKIRAFESSCQLKDSFLDQLSRSSGLNTTSGQSRTVASYSSMVQSTFNPNQHTLIVKPKSSNFSGNIANLLKRKVDPVKEKIRITGFKPIKNTIFINFSNKNYLENFRSKVEANCSELTAQFPKKKLPRIVFKYHQNQFNNVESLLSSLCQQNNINASTTKVISNWQNKFNKHMTNGVLELSRDDRYKIKKENDLLFIGYERLYFKDIFNVTQCKNCYKFGHISKQCNSLKTCPNCAETSITDTHVCKISDDTGLHKCVNCHTRKLSTYNHKATDPNCPIRQNFYDY